MLRICAYCGKEYKGQGKRYCFHKCRGAASRVTRQCEQCGRVWPSGRNRGKYCSRECAGEAKSTRQKCGCLVCSKIFYVKACQIRRGGGKYCSKQCHGMALRTLRLGENSPNWKGGKTPKDKVIRTSAPYREWRNAVYARDNWICQDCGDRNYENRGKTLKLHAHHIFPFADFPEHQLEVWNGITLCRNCHAKTHPLMAVQLFEQGVAKS